MRQQRNLVILVCEMQKKLPNIASRSNLPSILWFWEKQWQIALLRNHKYAKKWLYNTPADYYLQIGIELLSSHSELGTDLWENLKKLKPKSKDKQQHNNLCWAIWTLFYKPICTENKNIIFETNFNVTDIANHLNLLLLHWL